MNLPNKYMALFDGSLFSSLYRALACILTTSLVIVVSFRFIIYILFQSKTIKLAPVKQDHYTYYSKEVLNDVGLAGELCLFESYFSTFARVFKHGFKVL